MTHQVVVVNVEDNLVEAHYLFRKYKIRHLPVMEEGELVGILSLTDLQRVSFASVASQSDLISESTLLESLTVGQVMTKKPVSIGKHQSVADVAEILAEREFHALPVLNNGSLVGIVTTTDLVRYMLNQKLV